ncbi:MAG TPA: UvrD-helicase domain-containing protein [Candidatus Binataceae bacterium]|nr:UvrD-helicase domain-containing protein [Candidatus Binataceae bacterium]
MPSLNLDELNPEQRAAVLAPDGPILILAGAGSGKTRVLTYRIAHLMAARNVAPESMLAVTFTNKAAAEMRERVAALSGGVGRMPWVSTFHAACARILRQESGALGAGYDRNFTILDESDSLAAIRHVLEEAQLADSPPPELVRARLDQAKNEAQFPADLAAIAADPRERTMATVYQLYQARLATMNALDFGDLLLQTYRLMRDDPAALERWQRRAEYLLVDEYQDTNRVQYLLVSALAARSGNICVVGDEDQSIYRWRGADIRNILDFERDFSRALIFKLEQNYRSTRTILAAADTVIQNNRERKAKRLWTANPDGEPVTYYTGMTERDEADFIAREITQLGITGATRPADVVVFYRVNAQSRVIEEALVRRRLPYYIVGGLRFYDQREIKDLIAYLRVILNPADALALERMIGVPPRGIGGRTVEAMGAMAARDGVSLFEAMGRIETDSKVALRIAKAAGNLYAWMRDLIARRATLGVRALLDDIIVRSGFAAHLEAMIDGATRRQNVAELLAAASAFDTEHGPGGLGEFLERVALVNDSDQLASAGGRVALMTLHTSKGLEYPVVFIAGMEEGLFPHMRSQDSPREIEEERRLCYVGMTRARRLLYLTNTLSRELYGNRQEARPSRFLGEVDRDLIRRLAPIAGSQPTLRTPTREPYVDYTDSQVDDEAAGGGDPAAIGARVQHTTFGRGVVRRREGHGDGAKVWVNFERGGLKLLVLKFANLRPVAD